jgi:hypothetical protein
MRALEKMVSIFTPPGGLRYGQVRYMDQDGKADAPVSGERLNHDVVGHPEPSIYGHLAHASSTRLLERLTLDEPDYGEMSCTRAWRRDAPSLRRRALAGRKHRGAITAKLELDRQERSWLKILEGAGEPSAFGLSRRRLTFYAYLALARQAYSAGMPKTRRYLLKALAHRWPWLANRDGLEAIALFVKSLLPRPVRTFGARLKGLARV